MNISLKRFLFFDFVRIGSTPDSEKKGGFNLPASVRYIPRHKTSLPDLSLNVTTGNFILFRGQSQYKKNFLN